MLRDVQLDDDQELATEITALDDAESGAQRDAAIKTVREMVDLRVLANAPAPPANVKAKAKSIKGSPLYRDVGIQDTSNWLEAAMIRFIHLFPKINPPKLDGANVPLLPG